MPPGFDFDRLDEDEDRPRRGRFFRRQRAPEPKVLFRVDHSLPFEEDPEDESDLEGFQEESRMSRGDRRQRKSRRGVSVLAAAVILAAFGGFVAYSYFGGGNATEQQAALPVLRADIEAGKQRPEDPGGMEVPYQDRVVLNELEAEGQAPRVERLLPPPETPQLPTAEDGAAPDSLAGETPAAETDTAPSLEQVPAAGIAEKAESIQDLVSRSVADAEPAAQEGTAAGNEGLGAESLVAELPGAPAKPDPASGTQAAAASSAATAVAGPDSFAVQLASVKEKGRIDSEWRKLQEKHPDLLGKRNYLVQEVKIENQGTFYRLQTGRFSSRDGADSLCADLKAREQPCIVVKR